MTPELLEVLQRRVGRYAGVGARATPEDVLPLMTATAARLAALGWELYSGGASGADEAFEAGVPAGGRKKIFLPYSGFRGRRSQWATVSDQAMALAEKVHPAWSACSPFARLAHGRNAYQVLGPALDAPVDLLICWTPDGARSAASATNAGGTRTAIVLAEQAGVPVLNLGHGPHRQALCGWLATAEARLGAASTQKRQVFGRR